MTAKLRAIVSKRETIPAEISATLKPLEEGAIDQLIGVSAFKTQLLLAHGQAALPVDVGSDVIRLVDEAAHHAEECRQKLGAAHSALRPIVEHYFKMSGAECPPNEYFTAG